MAVLDAVQALHLEENAHSARIISELNAQFLVCVDIHRDIAAVTLGTGRDSNDQ